MSPPQPPLGCFCVAPVIHLDEVNLVCLSPLIAAAPLRFGCTAYFQTPHGLCGGTPLNRGEGWGYLNAILLQQMGGGKALIQ